MPAGRLSMRKIFEVLRLHHEQGLNNRMISQSVGLSPSTVSEYLSRAKAAGIAWPLEPTLDEAEVEARLFSTPGGVVEARVPPDCEYLRREMAKKRGITLLLLWEEYKHGHPEDGYQYSQFCDIYRRFCQKLDVVLRQEYKAGERLFVDFSGDGIPITDPDTGRIWEAQLFVAVLGASCYTYAEAFADQTEPSWIQGHVHTFAFLGGVPELVVPDNTKTAVDKAHRYDPDLNRTYAEMARHCRTAILPARKYKPRDKAKVESGVQIAQRWILARLRNHTFFSLEQANEAIAKLLVEFNARKFDKIDTTRQELFVSLDKPALKSLPATPYEYATWATPTVHIDYHVELEKHFYSVPFALCRKKVDARLTQSTVEIFFRGHRVASHPRSYVPHRATTNKDHMPEHHRQVVDWDPERILNWVGQVGPFAAKLAQAIMESKDHPELGYRSCLGLVRLGQKYTPERLEKACERALLLGAPNYKSVASLLKTKLDQVPPRVPDPKPMTPIVHENIRGPEHYH